MGAGSSFARAAAFDTAVLLIRPTPSSQAFHAIEANVFACCDQAQFLESFENCEDELDRNQDDNRELEDDRAGVPRQIDQ